MTTVLVADSAVIDFRNALAAGGIDVGPVTDLLVDAMRHGAAFYTIAQPERPGSSWRRISLADDEIAPGLASISEWEMRATWICSLTRSPDRAQPPSGANLGSPRTGERSGRSVGAGPDEHADDRDLALVLVDAVEDHAKPPCHRGLG